MTSWGFAELTRMLNPVAREHCQDRLIAVLEGGYNVDGFAVYSDNYFSGLTTIRIPG